GHNRGHVHTHTRSSSLVESSAPNINDLRTSLNRLRADNEVLSRKLVEAVELRASVEDTVSMQNNELEQLRRREAEASAELAKLTAMMESGELVSAAQVRTLMEQVVAEREMRTGMESELEELSAAVMVEANKLVSDEVRKRVSA